MANSECPSVKNLESFLEINLLHVKKVLSYTSKYLTKPGDNYGSIMLAVDVEILNKNGSHEILKVVAKLPPGNDFYWKLFEPQRTLITESSIYNILGPAIEKLEEDSNISVTDRFNVLAKCYGSRISLLPDSKIVDKDAILLFENLVASGYKVVNRLEGFDYLHAKVILKNLAEFHALPIGLRVKRPEWFKKNLMPFIHRYDPGKNFEKENYEDMLKASLNDIKSFPEFNTDEFMRKVDYYINLSRAHTSDPNDCEDSLFSTVAHSDFWVNNILVLYDDQNNPIKIKMVDFQLAQYESLANDVIFFIISSIKNDLIEKYYDEFLKLFYEAFIKKLQAIKCDTAEYSFNKFESEIQRFASIQFFHILIMLKVVLMEKDNLPDDFKDMGMDVFKKESSFSKTYFDKLEFFIKFFVKKGYLN